MKNLKVVLLAVVAIVAISACSKDDEPVKPPVVEEEVFTTVIAVFTPVGGGTTITLKSRDLDGGDGPNVPIVSVSGSFALGKTYNGEVTALDETKTPIKDMTEEINDLPLEHQLFYVKTTTLPAFNYRSIADAPSNYDVNGKPVGLKSVFTTTTAASGSLKIVLKHEGNKSAPNVANGDITNATGATDFEVDFSISVQ